MIKKETLVFSWDGEDQDGVKIKASVDIVNHPIGAVWRYLDKEAMKHLKKFYMFEIDPKTRIKTRKLMFPILP